MIVVTADGTTIDIDDVDVTPAIAQYCYFVEIVGADGRVWDLNNGPVYLCDGVKGLFDPPPSTMWLPQTVGIPGSRYLGEQVDEHTFTLPLQSTGADWHSWRDVDRDFFAKSLRSDPPSTLRVTAPDGTQATIPVRRVSVGDPADDMDPLLTGARKYPDLAVVAPQPYWEMPDVVRQFTFDSDRSFFTGAFRFLSSGLGASSATITNPGDVTVFFRATITGPATDWTVGLDGQVISSSTPLATGQHIFIDGRVRSITDDAGARAYRQVERVAFPRCPPGVDVPVVATMTGYSAASSIEVAITPLRERPL